MMNNNIILHNTTADQIQKIEPTLLSVQYLRGIAAIMVVLYHFRANLNGIYAQKNLGDMLFGRGGVGVDLFFIVSGFIIAYSTQKNLGGWDFIVKRIFRLYPIYLACMLAMALIPSTSLDVNYLKSLFFIHLDYEGKPPVFGYSTIFVAWTLTYEILFYTIFFLSQIISHKYRSQITIAVIVLFVIILQYYLNNGQVSFWGSTTVEYDGYLQPILKLLSSPMMIDFSYGIAIYLLMSFSRGTIHKLNDSLVRVFCISGAIYFTICLMTGYRTFSGPIGAGVSCAALFISILIYEVKFSIKNYKSIMLIGNLSYGIYLSHVLVIRFIQSYGGDIGLVRYTSGFSKVLLMISITLIISYFLHVFIEKPFIKIGRSVITKTTKRT
ncbi:acyltransferase family protein [Pantoea sp. FN060301]|uniref:acyltransferase family protein n=1 Tax=Pantoea sp. FN060301 TaxID=3420380 RepID=UPI003D179313